MKIAPRDQQRFLKSQPFGQTPCVVLYGPNEGRVQEVGQILKKTIIQDDDPFSYVPLDAKEIADDPAKLADELAAGSLMGGQRLIHITHADEKTAYALKNALEAAPSPENRILIEAGNLTPRSGLRKTGEEHAQVAILAFYDDTADSIADLIRQEVHKAGKKIDQDALIALQQAMGTNRQLAFQNLGLLITYIGDQDSISMQDVQACFDASISQPIDRVVRAVMTQNLLELDTHLAFLVSEGTSPIAVIRALQNHFYRLRSAHALIHDKTPVDRAMKSLKPPVFFKEESAFKHDLKRWSVMQIDQSLKKLIDAEKNLKSTLHAHPMFLHRCLASMGR